MITYNEKGSRDFYQHVEQAECVVFAQNVNGGCGPKGLIVEPYER